ncbi:MAG: DNA polymerase III subunit beta [Nitrospiraceae bacterium]|nr:DNA polymerase III subunit beta [Nitrospiraceae bacterium]
MKITIAKTEFQQRLSDIQPVVEKKSTMPILSHFLLKTAKSGSTITATDLETAIREPIAAEVAAEGALSVPARKLFEIVREVEGDIQIETEDSQWIRVKAGPASFRIACLPAEDYPLWPDLGASEQIEVDARELARMIEKTAYAAGESDTRYTLNGILFHLRAAERDLTIVGTDGHRMAVISMPLDAAAGWTGTEEKKLIVQRKAATELEKFLPGVERIKISLGKNHVLFQVGEVLFLTRLIEGSYPNYGQVIPANNEKKITVSREAFIRALRRVSVMSRERSNAVRMDASQDLLTLNSSNPDLGEAKDEVPARYSGDSISLGFNARYLIEALSAMEGENVTFELQDPLSPTLLRPEGEPSYRCVIMPMRI